MRAFINGNIITNDTKQKRVMALLVSGETIVCAGTNDQVLQQANKDTTICDLRGKTVIPGFNDNHIHAVHFGNHLLSLDLSGCNETQIVDLIKEKFTNPFPGQLIQAFNWDYTHCPNPTKELLDSAFPNNPVILTQFSGHGQWMNSKALDFIGVTTSNSPKSWENRTGIGEVMRDKNGKATGVVRDLGVTRLYKRRHRLLFFNTIERERCLSIALKHFAQVGITSVQDNTWYYPQLVTLSNWYKEGKLSARFSTWSLSTRRWSDASIALAYALGITRLNWIERGPIKYFLDGTFTTKNACLCEPFADGSRGMDSLDSTGLRKILVYLATKKRQAAFHIIGDKGIQQFLDVYENVLLQYPILRKLRIRIEHGQLVRKEDFDRLANGGILMAVQPSALCNPEKDIHLLGEARSQTAYPYRSLLNAGVALSFGSDIPGETIYNPIQCMHLAVNRQGNEAISIEEALYCYTVGSAYAECKENKKGKLIQNYVADFCVLSQDLYAVDKSKIGETQVLETVVGGRTVYTAEEKATSRNNQ